MTAMAHPVPLAPPAAVFLARHGLSDALLEPLPADASPRSYSRLPGQGTLLMEDRTDPEGYAAFIRLARHLKALGLSAPRVFGSDPAAGLALIEDFGTDTYGRLLAEGHDEEALYELAIDALVHLHSHRDAASVSVPAYDIDLLLEEVSRFSNWFAPELSPGLDIGEFDASFRAMWMDALKPVEAAPRTLVLRDFHIDNLMLLADRSGVAACGLLDFQDGVIGPGEYDLASLLQDARRDLAPGLEQRMIDRYLDAVPPFCGARGDILHRYHLMAAQRHTRLMGQFIRLKRRDSKPGYLKFMPRVAAQMQAALTAAGLTGISDFLDASLPGWRDAGERLATLS
ncbi:aminoglycoside phosphotransferase family protein [Hoeflea sp.]|uniref:aminoglycoside phosphotransferase family protein n=1 Tax=Hoeflea sp. TaxID=1940281 RepID=UPI003B5154D4